MRSHHLSVAFAALAFSTVAQSQAVPPANLASAPLIERSVLFGNPVRANARISPDGQWVSWTAPSNGVMNIWVAPAADPAKARVLTTETTRPIRQYFWAPNSRQVMFIQDKGGDENFLLYGVDVKTGKQTTLTPFEKTRVQIVGISNRVPNRILVGLNNRDPKWHDIHSLDLDSGKLTLVKEGTGFASAVADDNLNLRVMSRPNAAGGEDWFEVKGTTVADKPFVSFGIDDSQTTAAIGFRDDDRTMYMLDSRGRNTAALFARDMTTGKATLLAEDARADIDNVMANPKTGLIEAWSSNYLKADWRVLSPAVKDDIAFLDSKAKGAWSVVSRTLADDRWVVTTEPSDAPPAAWLYDRKAKSLTKMFVGRPALERKPLARMHPVEIASRDGKTLVSYLTLPPTSDPDGDGRPAAPVPMVLFVHGGPWARDDYGYAGTVQFLANRGYAVLQVNFRGSTGFGKAFVNAGNGAWGREMHDDLLDGVQWAVKNGVTTADKVAIMGGSYGGYATLAGLAFTPTAFACGVDIVGPSNLSTLLSTVPPYWESFRKQLIARMGDPDTEAGRAWLKERSPLFSADRIVRPLLIGQGANDPRVKQAESDQIVAAMQAKNIPVTYVLFPDEGHGFARPVNNIAFNAVTENFLARCLGGRAQPIGGDVRASTAKVPHGAEYAPGLADALK
ncbi:S9 family peptidase [Sandaracinobacteroides saxicola]|uniref:S9 family peptidase n=1 Tax=Sandaracinobacteroides saxicola TaxID=2759707 RepID=A0A7G5IDR9_9SPHN|nr:S9 family peptidase [Sandaracinobacteroides saxicola]QMW21511.1 S9 family peptidase [Sandaracinobacteroides saxicola]